MATMRHNNLPADQDESWETGYYHELTREESIAFFDEQVRQVLNISGEEFLERWDAGEFRPVPDTPEGWKVGRLVMLIPFARRTSS